MAKLRLNRGDLPVDPSLGLGPQSVEKGAKAYKDWHWGLDPVRVKDWNDPDMPDMLIECGRLIRIHVAAPQAGTRRHPRRNRDTMIEFSRSISSGAHIAFDPDHPHERLYLLVPPRARHVLRERFWEQNTAPAMNLNQAAAIAGGRHAKNDYPQIQVKPIGVMTAVVYFTDKKGDGKSYYIHKMGEVSHHYPILCVDASGRLWIAGGNYTSPTPGITD